MKHALLPLRDAVLSLVQSGVRSIVRALPLRELGSTMAVTATFAAAVLTAGCGWFGPPKTALRDVTVIAQDAANHESATSVDLVFVYDASSAAALPRTGPEWFSQKARLMIALGQKIDVATVELPAAQTLAPVPLPPRHKKALVVYCYVNFVFPSGQGVADLTSFKRVRITLAPQTVTYAGDR